MTVLEQIEESIGQLRRPEKAALLRALVAEVGDDFPGIESLPEVCGGEPCIVRTRIPVWLLVHARRLGTAEAELLRIYPTLRAEDIAQAWAYSRAHREEIDAQIAANEKA